MSTSYTKSKIVLISQYFYPEMISTGHILTELLVELSLRGLESSVICAQPTYYSREKVANEIEYNSIKIKRTFNTQFDKNSFIGKIFNSFSFFISALLNLIRFKTRCPVVVVTNPPFSRHTWIVC